METSTQINKRYVQIGALVVLIIILIIGYSAGYRFKNNFAVGKVGKISMSLPIIQTSVFVDETKQIETTKDNQDISLSLSPRTHNIIISHIGYYPWTKKVTVPSNGEITLYPIFVTTNASGQIITKNDPEYWTLRNQVTSSKPPMKSFPIVSSDKSTKVWMEDNAIIAETGSATSVVIQPDTIIKNVDFYKNRSDSVVFSTHNGVYVIEINKETTQNFMPIYKGTDPYFMKGTEGFIYILDGDNLMQVVI